MKQSLHLNLNQHIMLTPQLQQAIRLLQLSTFDLRQEIQLQIESNPMLEADLNDSNNDIDEPSIENTTNAHDEFSDFQWSNLYTNTIQNKTFNEDNYQQKNLYCTSISLQDYLRWQLELTPISNRDSIIAITIIDAINDDGYITGSLTDLHNSLNSPLDPLSFKEMEAVRHRIQHFDPIGCGVSSLAETLLIQLEQLPPNTLHLDLAKKIINENIRLLGKHNYRKLMKIYTIDESTLNNILTMIQHLHPKPGNRIDHVKLEHIKPDLTVKKINQHWQVTLNSNTLPHLSINTYYASLLNRMKNRVDTKFLKYNLHEARWFLKNIQNRQETLLKVACYIVDYQKEFLEFGAVAMKPLILNDVADALGMHESTISRVTTQKFICTPRGVFELKYFFSSHVSTTIGGECSSTAIKAVIKKLIDAESHERPLSDSKIVALINEQGIKIARRTVAKYREDMCIAPSSERKSINY